MPNDPSDLVALLRAWETVSLNPSPQLAELLDRADTIIGSQIQFAKFRTRADVLLQRLKQDYGRGYLLGGLAYLRERFNLKCPEIEYAYVYVKLIVDPATALEICSRRMVDLQDNACEKAIRQGAREAMEFIERHTPAIRLARFLQFGDPDVSPPMPIPGARA